MMEEETICLQCGDGGFTNAFVYCVKCLKFAVHRYCLDVLPNTLEEYVHWVCDDCEAKVQSRFYVRKHDDSPSPTRDHKVLKHTKLFSEKGMEEIDPMAVQIPTDEPVYKDNPEEAKVEANLMDQIELPATSQKKPIKKKKRRRVRYTMKKRKRNVVGKSSTEKDQQKPGKTSTEQPNEKRMKVEINEVKENKGSEQSDQTCISKQRCDSDTDIGIEERNLGPSNYCIENREPEDKEDKVFANCRRSNILDASAGKPVLDPIWRGSFGILNKKYNELDDVLAHISSKACQKVFETASQFRPWLQFEMLPRSEIWPKSFETSNPNGDNIALYFFPSNKSERFYDYLVEKMMSEEVGLKAVVQNAELLIFTSVELPLIMHLLATYPPNFGILARKLKRAQLGFQSKYYLWGVFREKQCPSIQKRFGDESPLSPLSNSPCSASTSS